MKKVLFIGGTGVISSACAERCLKKGMDLYLLNRGRSFRAPAAGAKNLKADINDTDTIHSYIKSLHFDVIVQWIAYNEEDVKRDVSLFKGKTSQYIFISSASAYTKPPQTLPITEKEPLYNPFWKYSRDKIACEMYLMEAYKEKDFPVTIVRPSHTYDNTKIPLYGGYTAVDRMRRGKRIVLHGDGTSLWTLTNHRDFAVGFCGLLGNAASNGEDYHITSDEFHTWNNIAEIIGEAAGASPDIIHIPSDYINRFDKEWGSGLLGDKSHCLIFDNAKIKTLVPEFEATIPFTSGIKEIISWYDSDAAHRIVDTEKDRMMDKIIEAYSSR